MRTQQSKDFIDKSFGFPIRLVNPLWRNTSVGRVLDVNNRALTSAVVEKLISNPGRLTGDHIRFLRNALNLTLEAFGNLLGVSHAAVVKWQDYGRKPTNMSVSTERDIRMLALVRFEIPDCSLEQLYRRFERGFTRKQGEIVVEFPLRRAKDVGEAIDSRWVSDHPNARSAIPAIKISARAETSRSDNIEYRYEQCRHELRQ